MDRAGEGYFHLVPFPENREHPAMNLHVDSEAGTLRRAVLHRPGLELLRLTPTNKDAYLYDEVPWVRRAQQEHDGFAEALRQQGVEVHLLDRLLTETLELPEARRHVLDHTFDERVHGPVAADALHDLGTALPAEQLATLLVGGLTKAELLEHIDEPGSVAVQSMAADDFVLAPLPNHLFTRDTSAWVYDGVAVNAMRKRARTRETIHYEAIYRWHPAFAGAAFRWWADGATDAPATIEGGDILVLGRGSVLVGVSERTTTQGVERMARRLFDAGSAQRIVALVLPRQRAFMHLDTVMTMVDEESFAQYAGLGLLPSYTIEPGDTDKELAVTAHAPEEMHAAIAAALGLDRIRVLTPTQDVAAAHRAQGDDGGTLKQVRLHTALA